MINQLYGLSPLLCVPLVELLRIWGEFVEAYYGCNGCGGNVAEISAYRLMPYSPKAHTMHCLAVQQEVNAVAAGALVALLEEFCNHYDAQATISDMRLSEWYMLEREKFDHCVHVRIEKVSKG